MSGNHSAVHAQFRIQDAINARLEEISFRKGVATGASALLFLAGLGVVTAELVGQASPASGALSSQAGGASAVTAPPGSASAPGSAAPSHPPRRSHAQPRRPHAQPQRPYAQPQHPHAQPRPSSQPSSHPAAAVSAIPPAGSRPGSWHRWAGNHDWDGWHRGDRGWDGWGPGGGDPWHGGHHW